MVLDLATVRTVLFVPGDRPERFDKALASGADLVVVDLEDAVAPSARAAARLAVASFGSRDGVGVRVNAVGTSDHPLDAALVRELGCPVMLAKTEAPPSGLGDGGVIALVETARGILAAPTIAAAPTVARLALGHLDLAAELGVDPDARDALGVARSGLVLASAAAGLAPPIDGVTADVRDEALLRDDVSHARRLGFGGKLCIHPAQVGPVAEAFASSADEVAWARRVVAASNDSVTVLDGRMVDRPVVERARRILQHPEGSS